MNVSFGTTILQVNYPTEKTDTPKDRNARVHNGLLSTIGDYYAKKYADSVELSQSATHAKFFSRVTITGDDDFKESTLVKNFLALLAPFKQHRLRIWSDTLDKDEITSLLEDDSLAQIVQNEGRLSRGGRKLQPAHLLQKGTPHYL